MSFHQDFRQKNWIAEVKAKEAETTRQASIPAQPAKAWDAQFSDIQAPNYCAICTPPGKIYPSEYPVPVTADWPESEEEKRKSRKK